MKHEDITDLSDLATYIKEHKSTIAVRAQVDGKWGNFVLSDLPADQAIDEALRFIEDRRIPIKLMSDK